MTFMIESWPKTFASVMTYYLKFGKDEAKAVYDIN